MVGLVQRRVFEQVHLETAPQVHAAQEPPVSIDDAPPAGDEVDACRMAERIDEQSRVLTHGLRQSKSIIRPIAVENLAFVRPQLNWPGETQEQGKGVHNQSMRLAFKGLRGTG